jgi:hypothetical protein
MGTRILTRSNRGQLLDSQYGSDFSVDEDGWTGTRVAVAGNIDGIGGQNDNLRFTLTDGLNSHYGKKAHIVPAGMYGIVTFYYYLPSANTKVDTLVASWNGVQNVITGMTTKDAWTLVAATVIATAARTQLYIIAYDGADGTPDADGDVYYIRQVNLSTRV